MTIFKVFLKDGSKEPTVEFLDNDRLEEVRSKITALIDQDPESQTGGNYCCGIFKTLTLCVCIIFVVFGVLAYAIASEASKSVGKTIKEKLSTHSTIL